MLASESVEPPCMQGFASDTKLFRRSDGPQYRSPCRLKDPREYDVDGFENQKPQQTLLRTDSTTDDGAVTTSSLKFGAQDRAEISQQLRGKISSLLLKAGGDIRRMTLENCRETVISLELRCGLANTENGSLVL